MKIREISRLIEDIAPIVYQESYDNSGLAIGDPDSEIKSILCTLDVTQEVLEEAVSLGVNLIISHHPIIFEPLRKLHANNPVEQIIIEAIKKDIAIYCAHTNLDNSTEGVNSILSKKLELKNCEILKSSKNFLLKLVVFVPSSHADIVRKAIFDAGAGSIGNYDNCSYNLTGKGTFKAGENTDPYVGEKGLQHIEEEIRIETIVPKDKIDEVIKHLIKVHPYEEVAYDVYPLLNDYKSMGSGMIGELNKEMNFGAFMELLKRTFNIPVIRYAGIQPDKILRVAVCGGAGSFLIKNAINSKADAFLTGDLKYHQFFDASGKILLCDIGHYESEQFTKELFYLLLKKKSSTFAVHLSKVITNPIKYYL